MVDKLELVIERDNASWVRCKNRVVCVSWKEYESAGIQISQQGMGGVRGSLRHCAKA